MSKRFCRYFLMLTACIVLSIALTANPAHAGTAQSIRLSGLDRYKTAAAISKFGWPDKSEYAVLARGDDFPDALCAGPLAQKYNAPILLTEPDRLNPDALSELKRLGVAHVFITGGTGAVSEEVENSLKAEGINNVERLWGNDRYETAVKIAEKVGAGSSIVLATGNDFPDALSVSAIASSMNMPILLTDKEYLPDTVKQYVLNNKGINKTYIIGGEGVISPGAAAAAPGPDRIWGTDRYGTNVAVMERFQSSLDFESIYLAVADGPYGNEFADALAGSALAAKSSSPILLVYRELSSDVESFIKPKMSIDTKITCLGGEAVVPQSIADYMFGIIKAVYNITNGKYYETIQAAIDNASPGDAIKIAPGVYKEHISITRDNIKLIGEDRDKTIIDAAQDRKATKAGIRVSSYSGIEIRNLTVRNAGVNATSEWSREPYGIYFYNSDKNIVDNVRLQGNGDYEIYFLNGCDNNVVQNCIIDGLVSGRDVRSLDGIFSCGGEGAGSGVSLMNTNNRFSGNIIKNVVYGISLTASSNNQINDNQIHASDSSNWSYSVSAGIILSNSSSNTIQENNIDTAQYGIRLSTLSDISPYAYAGEPKFNTIKGNNINTIYHGIRIVGNGNKLKDNTVSGCKDDGIWLANTAMNTDISGNILYGNTVGMLVDSASNSIRCNKITGGKSGLKNTLSDTFDASFNYWGDVNPEDVLEGHVSYSPWLGIGDDSSTDPGFQRANTMTWCFSGSIDDALSIASDGDTIKLAEGTYVLPQQLIISKNLTIEGSNSKNTILKFGFDTESSGDKRSGILVKSGAALNLSNLTVDGSGRKIMEAVRSAGSGKIDNVHFKNIYYQKYQGSAIAAYGSARLTILNSSFSNIEKDCVYVSENAHVDVGGDGTGNTFTGSGAGDFKQHAVFASKDGGNPEVFIIGNKISSFIGTLKDESWTSNGIYIEYGSAVINDSTLSECNDGIVLKTGDSINGIVISPENAIELGKALEGGNTGAIVKIYNAADGKLIYPAAAESETKEGTVEQPLPID